MFSFKRQTRPGSPLMTSISFGQPLANSRGGIPQNKGTPQ